MCFQRPPLWGGGTSCIFRGVDEWSMIHIDEGSSTIQNSLLLVFAKPLATTIIIIQFLQTLFLTNLHKFIQDLLPSFGIRYLWMMFQSLRTLVTKAPNQVLSDPFYYYEQFTKINQQCLPKPLFTTFSKSFFIITNYIIVCQTTDTELSQLQTSICSTSLKT